MIFVMPDRCFPAETTRGPRSCRARVARGAPVRVVTQGGTYEGVPREVTPAARS